jgi:hypothetical protein
LFQTTELRIALDSTSAQRFLAGAEGGLCRI